MRTMCIMPANSINAVKAKDCFLTNSGESSRNKLGIFITKRLDYL